MDMTKEIMDKWYKAMEKNKISVQPKASTIWVLFYHNTRLS